MAGEGPMMPIGDLLESLGACNPKATVAVTIGHGADEKVGYIVSSTELDEDVFVLTAQEEEFIRLRCK